MASNTTQLQLALIHRNIEETKIEQRITDGYIDATGICKAAGKDFYDYGRLKSTKEFLSALSDDTGIPGSGQKIKFTNFHASKCASNARFTPKK